MRILHASSELFPYSKTGGLADMVDGLAKALAGRQHQVGVVTPLYRGLMERFAHWQMLDYKLELPLGKELIPARVWTQQPRPNLTLYFIDQPHFYDRPGLYQQDGHDYPDNAARFIYFSKCVAHLARHLAWRPELVHLHDWQTGLVPLFLRHQRDSEHWSAAPATVLTIHNLAFQGVFPVQDYALTGLPPIYLNSEGVEFYQRMSCLKAGLMFADFLSTVSPRYAREITTPELGCGLEGLLLKRQHVLTGILNGVDYSEWKTEQNPHLRYNFNLRQMRGKGLQKRALQKELGLPRRGRIPLFGVISRLSEQKGMDIELEALAEVLSAPMQFVLLGSGAASFVDQFTALAGRWPDKMALRIGHDVGLAHRIEAGADFFLMPSRFEPCGLNQLYSLRYGTIPIVRATGGLDDSVTDITEDLAGANGIKFHEYSAPALVKAIRKALVLSQHPALLRHFRRNAMCADFSWEHTCLAYEKLYHQALPAS
ncbi:MAG: glycogen synthase GlgA [Verrucomicrobia bacterium]|nr:glycogen synthase GlgA [Verrucomicrobiota bacterium]